MIMKFYLLALTIISPAIIYPVVSLSIGFDFGTSGVRCCVIKPHRNQIFTAETWSPNDILGFDSYKQSSSYPILFEDSISWADVPKSNYENLGQALESRECVSSWITALELLLERVPNDYKASLDRICCSGTSGSACVIEVDEMRYKVTRIPRMYDYNVISQSSKYGKIALDAISEFSPPDNPVIAPTSTLAKLITWNLENPIKQNERLVHQADLISHHLVNDMKNMNIEKSSTIISDWNNALKLGYDVKMLEYPDWMKLLLQKQGIHQEILPEVIEPGGKVGTISQHLADRLGLSPNCQIFAGTTDSIAAFLASGASKAGEAVTSLGSTLAIKMLSEKPVEDANRGIYSHRLGNQWLVGGASNAGCAVLRQLNFSTEELVDLSEKINPNEDINLDYYPLTKIGERFPVNDPNKKPNLSPQPNDRQSFLHGILQGLSYIEKKGYGALIELGATPPTEIMTAGGGSQNRMWTKMRERIIGVKTRKADNIDAAYGVALLSQRHKNN